jgi:hypothetical protein
MLALSKNLRGVCEKILRFSRMENARLSGILLVMVGIRRGKPHTRIA